MRSDQDRLRNEVEQELRRLCRISLREGDRLPSVRQLAQRHGISATTTNAILRDLEQEGILHSMRGRGTFVGGANGLSEPYALVSNGLPLAPGLREGFEERISEVGGTVMTLCPDALDAAFAVDARIQIAGIFDVTGDQLSNSRTPSPWRGSRVALSFQTRDDVDTLAIGYANGADNLTRFLSRIGHQRIAFVQLVPEEIGLSESAQGCFQGFQDGCRSLGSRVVPQVIAIPKRLVQLDVTTCAGQRELGRIATREMLMLGLPDAIIGLTDEVAFGLIEGLTACRIAPEYWPAIAGFGDSDVASQIGLTTMRWEYDELGRNAADRLINRSRSTPTTPASHRLIPPRLIRRLSSQASWAVTAAGVLDRVLGAYSTETLAVIRPASREAASAPTKVG